MPEIDVWMLFSDENAPGTDLTSRQNDRTGPFWGVTTRRNISVVSITYRHYGETVQMYCDVHCNFEARHSEDRIFERIFFEGVNVTTRGSLIDLRDE